MAVTKKTETKTAASVEKQTASKAPTKATTAAKKPAAKPVAKATAKTAAKPAAKTAVKKTATAKSAAKTVAKATAKKAPKKPSVTIDTICNKLEKMLPKKVSFKEKVAVDIEVWGFEDGSNAKMYIEANEGKVTVSPHTYDEKDFRVAVSVENAKAFVDGKMTLKEMLASPDFYAEGNIGAAVKLASIF